MTTDGPDVDADPTSESIGPVFGSRAEAWAQFLKDMANWDREESSEASPESTGNPGHQEADA